MNNMTIEELLVYGKKHIHSDHAKILLANLINKNSLELLTCLDEMVPEDKIAIYKKEVEALKEGKPIQYVLGNVNFHGINFYINENVLIPRFETEELVENTIKFINEYFNYPIDIIDLGTGSGVIGLTLEKKISTNIVDLVDISKEALEVTKKNIELLDSKANIIESNMFDNIPQDKKYDLIISNPPYIREDEEIEDIVKNNEPHIALYAKDNGLEFYKKILNNVTDHLKEKSIIAFEIGYLQKEDIIKLIKEVLPNSKIITKKDLSDKDRMIFIFNNIDLR